MAKKKNMYIEINNSYSTIKSHTDFEQRSVKKMLSYKYKEYPLQRIKTGSLYGNQILTGFLTDIQTFLSNYSNDNNQVIDRRLEPCNPSYNGSKTLLKGFELFPHQIEAIHRFLKVKRGILKFPTGAGKTLNACAIFKVLNIPTLWLTHRTNLCTQTARVFKKAIPRIESKLGLIADGEYSPNFLTIATTQSLMAKMKKNPEKTKKELLNYQFLIVDEAHRLGAKSFHEAVAFCNNAYYRLGLTATPFMKEERDNLYLKGSIGNVFHSISIKKLVNMGILAQPFFKFIDVNSEKINERLNDWHQIYEQGIVQNKVRNGLIAEATAQLIDLEKKPLVIAQRLQHCKLIKKNTDKLGYNLKVVSGKSKIKIREDALDELKTGTIDGIICTNIFDEGIDVKEVNAVVLASAGKSAPMIYQRVGRGIRKKTKDNYAIIIDFMDMQHPILKHHSKLRYNLIKKQSGFKII